MSSLITPIYSTSVIDSLFNEIVLRNSNYYFFIGKAAPWFDETAPPTPVDNEANYKEVRKSTVFLKKILPSEVSYLIPRINWASGTVYDMYDDRYGTEVIGVNITAGGSNYSNSTANAVITGNGSNANVSVIVSDGSISKVIVNNGGVGYTSGNVTFYGSPGAGATGSLVLARSSSNKTRLKECTFYVLTSDNHVYKCLDNNNGAVSTVMPTLTTVNPFTTSDGYKWKFLYKIPDALRNRFLTANYIPVLNSLTSSFYSNGTIQSAIIINGGSGYNTGTTIQVDGDGYQEGNKLIITGRTIVNAGSGFTTATLTVEDPYTSSAWAPSAVVNSGTKLKYFSNIYSVEISGTTGSSGPLHVSGSQNNGTSRLKFIGNVANLTATVSAGSINTVTINNPGWGYFFRPNVTITGGTGANVMLTMTQSRANLVPILQSGSLVGVTIVDGGVGYTYASANVVGVGSNAKIEIDLSNGGVDSLQAAMEQQAVDGAIYAIKIISGGYEYTEANVSISGSGTGASANTTITDGRITAINIINAGSGYKDATVTITGDGKGASARAILPPYGGHGYNAVRELFASNVGLYASFFRLENKGFTSINDYRRIGIIKNVSEYDSTGRYFKVFGSACWLITGTFNALDFPIDTEITQPSTGGVFQVVEVRNNQMLVTSKNGIIPAAGETITDGTYTFSIVDVEDPDVEIYSGDIIYVLNKEAFTIDNEQAVTIKTVLGF